jgi:uncharacterized protein
MRIAALGDLHTRVTSKGVLVELFQEISQKADVLLLCGDLTDQGIVEEAQVLLEDLQALGIPSIAVLGNHDYHNNQSHVIKNLLSQQGKIVILDNEPYEFDGVGFAGVKGFGGGFDKHTLGSFGEGATKQFVTESLNEEIKLENALRSLNTEKKVVLLHYAPIRETIEGEPLEIYPFLGSSRLADAIDHNEATVVFHGHTHIGKPQGKTLKGVPVYNCSLDVMKQLKPEQPYVLLEI